MADAPRRIDIGFQGGLVLPVRVTQEAHDEFRRIGEREAHAEWMVWFLGPSPLTDVATPIRDYVRESEPDPSA